MSAQHERQLVLLFGGVRVAVYGHGLGGFLLTWDHVHLRVMVVAAFVALALENAWVIRTLLRRGTMSGGCLVLADVLAALTALVLVTLALDAGHDSDVTNTIYPYSVGCMLGVGLGMRRVSAVLATSALAAMTYLALSVSRSGFDPRLLPNALTYFAWALTSWVLSRAFRRVGCELETVRRLALAREHELAAAHQREQTSRALHDRVLQTLELLDRRDDVTDPALHGLIRADAAWLRQLVRDGGSPPAPGLGPALAVVVEEQARAGLRVQVNDAGLPGDAVPGDVAEAVQGAVRELLTKVRKHAGVDRAVVRARTVRGLLEVTVLDQGRGMDPKASTPGLGLRCSVFRRLELVGGSAQVTSSVDGGTLVTLRVPLAGSEIPAEHGGRGVRAVAERAGAGQRAGVGR